MPDRLDPNTSIPVNGRITSPNANYSLVMQGDGNLVLYQFDYTPFFATATNGNQVTGAYMQEDGNFVVYSANNQPLWSSMTAGNPRSHLVMQDDGNVVIYDPHQVAIWSTGTWHNNSVLGPVTAEQDDLVGVNKSMYTYASLDRNGLLHVHSKCHSWHLTEGLRGRIRVTCLDYHRNAIWLSDELACKTCGSKGDLFTPSETITDFDLSLPELIGVYTGYLQVAQGDGTTGVNCNNVVTGVKAFVNAAAGALPAPVSTILQPVVGALHC